jgi:hypothetical protein
VVAIGWLPGGQLLAVGAVAHGVLSSDRLACKALGPEPVGSREPIALSCFEKREIEELGGLLPHRPAETLETALRGADHRNLEALLAEYILELSRG